MCDLSCNDIAVDLVVDLLVDIHVAVADVVESDVGAVVVDKDVALFDIAVADCVDGHSVSGNGRRQGSNWASSSPSIFDPWKRQKRTTFWLKVDTFWEVTE